MKKSFSCLCLVITLASCSSGDLNNKKDFSVNLIKDGSISISRPLPPASELKLENVLSFMPLQLEKSWISVDSKNGKLALMKGDSEVETWDAEFSSDIIPGTYRIILKEKNAPWYASDEYFQSRGLDIPPQNSQERYLKSVLGENSIFLDNGLSIFSSEFKDESVKGIRVSAKAAAVLYDSLQAGDLFLINQKDTN